MPDVIQYWFLFTIYERENQILESDNIFTLAFIVHY